MAIDKIGSKALVDCSVAAADIAPGTITAAKLAGSIANAKLANSTVTINGTSIALGASGSVATVAWQSVVVSDGSTVTTMVAGRGYFVNNTSAAGIVKLPTSASAGDTVAIKDYAGNFATNNLTIQRNGHNIQGVANDSLISTNRASLQLVYIDATKGWLFTNESNVQFFGPEYIAATGGTVTTSGNDKIHTFTGDGNFVVSSVGNCAGSNKVSYLVVAGGGGGGGRDGGGGGGAGGFREGKDAPKSSYTVSPLNAPAGLPVSAQTYPITVGGGGAGGLGAPSPGSRTCGTAGSNSIFSTITSAGGGKGAIGANPACTGKNGGNGGSGGGGGGRNRTNGAGLGGSGNTPPVSPAQGTNGGGSKCQSTPSLDNGGGGGGATVAGGTGACTPGNSGVGGTGATTHITGSPVAYAGGGTGGTEPGAAAPASPCGTGGQGARGDDSPAGNAEAGAGTANRGGGGGGASGGNGPANSMNGAAGGKGVVIIRYKFQ